MLPVRQQFPNLHLQLREGLGSLLFQLSSDGPKALFLGAIAAAAPAIHLALLFPAQEEGHGLEPIPAALWAAKGMVQLLYLRQVGPTFRTGDKPLASPQACGRVASKAGTALAKRRRLCQAKRRHNAGRGLGTCWVFADARPNLLTDWACRAPIDDRHQRRLCQPRRSRGQTQHTSRSQNVLGHR